MKEVKSVFRDPSGEQTFDPAALHVEAVNKILSWLNPKMAEVLDHHLEEIINVRLRQDNVITEGSQTSALYHERKRWNSGLVHDMPDEDDQVRPEVLQTFDKRLK